VIKVFLFYAGFILLLLLFSEEFARAVRWLRAYLDHHPRYKIIAYPLIFVLAVIAGLIIATSLIRFATEVPFSYD
jgi:nitrate reductase gamma subunit